jgi:hypothetical protein
LKPYPATEGCFLPLFHPVQITFAHYRPQRSGAEILSAGTNALRVQYWTTSASFDGTNDRSQAMDIRAELMDDLTRRYWTQAEAGDLLGNCGF